MPVYLDVMSRLDERAAAAAARRAVEVFSRAGNEIGAGLGSSMSKAFGALEGGSVRAELQSMQAEYMRLSAAQAEAARVATRSSGEIEVAQRRLTEVTARYTEVSSQAARAQVVLADVQAKAARDMRLSADAVAATEAAHRDLGTATAASAAAVSRSGQVFNAVGIGSVAAFGGALVETTKKAADFQTSMTKLSAAASVPADQLKTISDGILQMAGKVGYSVGDLSNAMFDISKSGYSGADGLKVLNAAAQGANAEQADLNEVVKALTLSMHNFKASPEEASTVMSKMITAVGESKVSLNDFAGALHSIEPQAAQLHLSLSDVWGVLSQITASGTSADQAAEQMANTMRSLSGANAPARAAMKQFGIDADDVSQKIGQRGLAGTMQYLYEQTAKKIDPSSGLIDTGELAKNTQGVADLQKMIANPEVSDHARSLMQALQGNTISVVAYTKATKASSDADRAKLVDFGSLNNSVNEFSKRLKGGRDTLETLNQALNEETGTMSGAAIVMQTTGDHAKELDKRTQAIADTVVNADGTVKGFNESQDTLNAKMRDAHAAFGAAEAEIGGAFVPTMMSAANIAKDVGDAMAKHPGIMHAAIDAVGALAAAWVAFKGVGILSTLTGITGALEGMTAAEAAAAGGMTSVLAAAGPIAAAGAAGLAVAGPVEHGLDHSSWLNDHFRNPIRRALGMDDAHTGDMDGKGMFSGGYASGGAMNAPGPKGRDSALFWGAAGEHILTAADVDAMGGHANVQAFRNALHRSNGGAIPHYDNGGPIQPWLNQQLQAHGLSPDEAKGILAMNQVEGGASSPQSLLGFTEGQAQGPQGHVNAFMGQWNDPSRRGPGGSIPGVGQGGKVSDWNSYMTWIRQRIVGQNGAQSDWQGNAQPSAASYQNSLMSALGMPGSGRAGGVAPLGTAQSPIYTTESTEAAAKADARVKNIQERLAELKPTAKQSERDRLNDELGFAKEDQARAHQKADEAGASGGGRRGRGRSGGSFKPIEGGSMSGGSIPEMGGSFVTMMFDGLANAILGPMETAIGNALGFDPSEPSGGLLGMLTGANGGPGSSYSPVGPGRVSQGGGGGFADLGNVGTPVGGGSGGNWGASGGGNESVAGPGGGGGAGTPAASSPPMAGQRNMPAAGGHHGGWLSGFPAPSAAAPGAPGMSLFPGGGGLTGNPFAPDLPTTSRAHVDPTPQFGAGGSSLDEMNAWAQTHGVTGGPAGNGFRGDRGIGTPPDAGTASLFGDGPVSPFGGGPIGNDTVPAWVQPGEAIIPASQNPFHPQHFSGGTTAVGETASAPGPVQGPPPPAPPPPTQSQTKGSGAPQGETPSDPDKPSGNDADNQKEGGGGVGSTGSGGKGLGLTGGGLIGFAEQAPIGALTAAASGASFDGSGAASGAAAAVAAAAAQIGIQELNRTISYAGQMAGIGVQGALSTILPTDSPLSDFGNTLPGKLLTGISGATPAKPSSAGATKAPLASSDSSGSSGSGSGGETPNGPSMVINGMNVAANNADQFHYTMTQQQQEQNQARLQYTSPQGS